MNTAQLLQQYQQHTATLPSGNHCKYIGTNVLDVFSGKGFSTPTRYRLIKGTWVHVSGPQLSDAFLFVKHG